MCQNLIVGTERRDGGTIQPGNPSSRAFIQRNCRLVFVLFSSPRALHRRRDIFGLAMLQNNIEQMEIKA